MRGFFRVFRPGVALVRAVTSQLVRRVLNVLQDIEGDGDAVTIEKPMDANGLGWRVVVDGARYFGRVFRPRPNSLDAIEKDGGWVHANMPSSVGLSLSVRQGVTGGSVGLGYTYLNMTESGATLSGSPGGSLSLPVCHLARKGDGDGAKTFARQLFHGMNAEFRVREPDGKTIERPDPYFYSGNPFALRLWVEGFHTVAEGDRLDQCEAPVRFCYPLGDGGKPILPSRLDWVSMRDVRERLENEAKTVVEHQFLLISPGEANPILEPWIKYYCADYQKTEAPQRLYPQRLSWGMETPLFGSTTWDCYGGWAEVTSGNFKAAGASMAEDYPVDAELLSLEQMVEDLGGGNVVQLTADVTANAEDLAARTQTASDAVRPVTGRAEAVYNDAIALDADMQGAGIAIRSAAEAIAALEGAI